MLELVFVLEFLVALMVAIPLISSIRKAAIRKGLVGHDKYKPEKIQVAEMGDLGILLA